MRPVATAISVAMVPVGLLTIILGVDASRAFAVIGGGDLGGDIIARLMGALLLVGSLMTIGGITRFGAFVELIGLALVASGALLYAGGAVIGLGWQGSIAAGGYLSIAVGSCGRVVLIAQAAHIAFTGNERP